MERAVLTTVPSTIDAHMIKNTLERAGIRCILINENFSNLMPLYFGFFGSGVQLIVDQKDLKNARELTGLEDGKLKCPNCSSTNLRLKNTVPKIVMIIFSFLLFPFLFGNLIHDYQCEDCLEEFRK